MFVRVSFIQLHLSLLERIGNSSVPIQSVVCGVNGTDVRFHEPSARPSRLTDGALTRKLHRISGKYMQTKRLEGERVCSRRTASDPPEQTKPGLRMQLLYRWGFPLTPVLAAIQAGTVLDPGQSVISNSQPETPSQAKLAQLVQLATKTVGKIDGE